MNICFFVGNNSASVVADAYLSGLRNYDIETLWKAVVHGANAIHSAIPSTGRLGYEWYNKLGYVPYDKGDKDGNRWYLETPFAIAWSKENVRFLKTNSGKKGEGWYCL
jgi:putative alpha-1,2-mannosidase